MPGITMPPEASISWVPSGRRARCRRPRSGRPTTSTSASVEHGVGVVHRQDGAAAEDDRPAGEQVRGSQGWTSEPPQMQSRTDDCPHSGRNGVTHCCVTGVTCQGTGLATSVSPSRPLDTPRRRVAKLAARLQRTGVRTRLLEVGRAVRRDAAPLDPPGRSPGCWWPTSPGSWPAPTRRCCWPTSAPRWSRSRARAATTPGPGSRRCATASRPTTSGVNRNKRSIALDLKDADDLAVAQELARRADVVMENFKPGGLARFGLDYDVGRGDQPARGLRLDQRLRQRAERARRCPATT